MCFIGHGAFGIITKPVWCHYFAVFGIGKAMAYQLMPVVGTFDIFCGITILLYSNRLIPAWLLVWGTVTALLRPLAGEPFAEFIERAGNVGAPLALLLLPVRPDEPLSRQTISRVTLCLRIACFLLLLGHGWLGLLGKKGLLDQYLALGFSHPETVSIIIGGLETGAALLLLFRPTPILIVSLLVWKMTSELFYPHYELFEWIERGGSYGSLLALRFLILPAPPSPSSSPLASSADYHILSPTHTHPPAASSHSQTHPTPGPH